MVPSFTIKVQNILLKGFDQTNFIKQLSQLAECSSCMFWSGYYNICWLGNSSRWLPQRDHQNYRFILISTRNSYKIP